MVLDAMQLAAFSSVGNEVGGWHDKSEASDGKILQEMCDKFDCKVIPDIHGENWLIIESRSHYMINFLLIIWIQ